LTTFRRTSRAWRPRLARQGYEVITARDGEEALISARHEAPDLILLDV
jgi:DNA-binding response OmpR family regulator